MLSTSSTTRVTRKKQCHKQRLQRLKATKDKKRLMDMDVTLSFGQFDSKNSIHTPEQRAYIQKSPDEKLQNVRYIKSQ